ncbi:MAG TPA: cyclic nucleotide-binding domain-containing protein, partial [Polyangiales bacterium]|nr:cyclic nucleotide-binding domain-containing protein [Polyangiales bacterium]
IVLERFGGQVSFKTLAECEYFGELSLLDGQVRSASAVAVTDCEVIALGRENVLDCLGASAGTRRLLIELASRVRQADARVCELAERVSRTANANAHAAVSVELDTIKLLYQRTEHRAAQIIADAERSAHEATERANATLERANQVTASIEQQVKGALAVVKKRFVPAMTVVALLAGAIGVGSFTDLLSKYKEARAIHAELKDLESQMKDADRALRIVSETMTDVRGAREATLLNQPIETPADLRRVALSYELAQQELTERFLYAEADAHRYEKFEPEVVFEALDTWLTLALRDRMDGELTVDARTRRQLVDALIFVVRGLGQSASAGSSSLLLDIKLRDLAYLLGANADTSTKQVLWRELADIAERGGSARSRDNAALILASFGQKTAPALARLNDMLGSDSTRAAAALALAKLGDKGAFELIAQQLQRHDAVAYPFASALAKDGGAALDNLSAKLGKSSLLGRVRSAIKLHKPHNCFEQRYDHYLLECLDNRCGRTPNEPIGGSCTL